MVPTAIRLTSSGAVTYAVTTDPADGSYGTGSLAAGPDGNIWFADPVGGTLLSGAIGTIDITTGRATKFSTPLLSTTTQVTASTSQEQSCTSGTCTPMAPGTCVASPPAPGPNPPPPPTTCQTATTGPTAVLACKPVTATTGNAWTTTACGSVTGPAPVTACVPMAASGSNAWTQTSCTGITPGSQAYALTTGPDGAIGSPNTPRRASGGSIRRRTSPWSTSASRHRPSASRRGRTGSDGGMWFLKSGAGGTTPGRIDTATGQITLHAASLAGVYPLFGGIAAGPDGNI